MTPKEILEKRDVLSYTDLIDQIERGIGKVIYCGMDGIVTVVDDYCGFGFDAINRRRNIAKAIERFNAIC